LATFGILGLKWYAINIKGYEELYHKSVESSIMFSFVHQETNIMNSLKI
jgi:hypothetical protein